MTLSRAGRLTFAVFFVAVAGYALWQARFGIGEVFPRAALFPLAIGIPTLILALATLAVEIRILQQPPPVVSDLDEPEEAGPPMDPAVARRRTVAMMGWVVAGFLAIWLLGFSLAAPVITFLYLKVGAGEKWLNSILLAVVAYAFFWGVFDQALHIPLPEGLLFEVLEG